VVVVLTLAVVVAVVVFCLQLASLSLPDRQLPSL